MKDWTTSSVWVFFPTLEHKAFKTQIQSRWSTRTAAAWPHREAGSDRNRSAVRAAQYCHIPNLLDPTDVDDEELASNLISKITE